MKNKTEFGLFIGLENDVDGMVHLSDLDWNRPGEQVIDEFKKGDMVRAQVLDVDVEKERISLGIKQLGGDPFADAGEIKKGQIVTCEVLEVKDGGLEVKIVDTDLTTFIKRNELARDRADQRPERFAAGEKVDARVTLFDRKARRVTLSIKALEVAEEKEAIAQFGSSRLGRLARRHPRRGPEQGQDRQEVRPRASSRPACPGGISSAESPRDSLARAFFAGRRLFHPSTCRPVRVRNRVQPLCAATTTRREPMTIDAEAIADRRRLRRKLTFLARRRHPRPHSDGRDRRLSGGQPASA